MFSLYHTTNGISYHIANLSKRKKTMKQNVPKLDSRLVNGDEPLTVIRQLFKDISFFNFLKTICPDRTKRSEEKICLSRGNRFLR